MNTALQSIWHSNPGCAARSSQQGPRLAGRLAIAVLLVSALACAAYASEPDETTRMAIDAVLDDFHLAAAEADAERYLAHLTGDAVFLGTDDWERWPLPEFREYVAGRFADSGWTYTPESRHLALAGDIAWFDEIVVSPRWGRFRGTGVLRREQAGWKIAHYALSFLIPNESFPAVADMATREFERREAEPSP